MIDAPVVSEDRFGRFVKNSRGGWATNKISAVGVALLVLSPLSVPVSYASPDVSPQVDQYARQYGEGVCHNIKYAYRARMNYPDGTAAMSLFTLVKQTAPRGFSNRDIGDALGLSMTYYCPQYMPYFRRLNEDMKNGRPDPSGPPIPEIDASDGWGWG